MGAEKKKEKEKKRSVKKVEAISITNRLPFLFSRTRIERGQSKNVNGGGGGGGGEE